MRVSFRVSSIISVFAFFSGGALIGLFFFASNDYGVYPKVLRGEVRGQAVRQFSLWSNEIVIASRQANGEYAGDVLLITETSDHTQRIVRVIRSDSQLLIEQLVSTMFSQASWESDFNRFIVRSNDGTEALLLVPKDGTYKLLPAH